MLLHVLNSCHGCFFGADRDVCLPVGRSPVARGMSHACEREGAGMGGKILALKFASTKA